MSRSRDMAFRTCRKFHYPDLSSLDSFPQSFLAHTCYCMYPKISGLPSTIIFEKFATKSEFPSADWAHWKRFHLAKMVPKSGLLQGNFSLYQLRSHIGPVKTFSNDPKLLGHFVPKFFKNDIARLPRNISRGLIHRQLCSPKDSEQWEPKTMLWNHHNGPYFYWLL